MPTGLQAVIRLPAARRQPRRLLDVLDRLPGVEGNRWLEGVTWQPTACRALTVEGGDDCSNFDFNVVPDECEAAVTQDPFRVSDAFKAATLDMIYSEVDEMLASRFNLQVSASFASELLSGAASGGMSLSSEASAPNGAAFGVGATPIWNALAILEEEIAERLQGGVGYIHLPPGLLSQAVSECELTLNTDGQWETPVGNIVISDAGYINPPPPTGEGASSGAEDWIYASGPVWFESTVPILIGQGSETLTLSENTFTQYIAGYGILVFDPCPVTAVLVSYNIEALLGS
jgi:hypothetical protein